VPAYKVAYDKPVYSRMRKLSLKTREAIDDAVLELSDDPYPDGCKKLEGRDDAYRIAVGNSRVIYVIVEDEVLVLIIKIGPRKEVYKDKK